MYRKCFLYTSCLVSLCKIGLLIIPVFLGSTGKVFFVLPAFIGSTGKVFFVLPVFKGSTEKVFFVVPVFIEYLVSVDSLLKGGLHQCCGSGSESFKARSDPDPTF